MTGVNEILAELEERGIRIELRLHGGVRLIPARLIDPPLLDLIRSHKTELLMRLHAERRQIDTGRRPARADGRRALPLDGAPAYSILETCRQYGVALGIDGNGDLVVGKEDGAKTDEPTQPWISLIMALEAHNEAVRDLVSAGWTLKADISKQSVA